MMTTRCRRTLTGAILGLLFLLQAGISQAAVTRNTRFGTAGVASKDIAGGDDTAAAVLVASNNKVIVVGNSVAGLSSHISLARYLARSGHVDTTFSAAQHPTAFSSQEQAEAAVWQGDRILVVGSALVGDCRQMVLGRFLSTGDLDTSFGTNGWVHLDIGLEKFGACANTYAYDVAFDSTGNQIIAVGKVENPSGQYDFAVVFLDSNGGRLDAVGKTDIVVHDFTGLDDRARGIAINGGFVYVGGTAKTGSTTSNNFAVLCLDKTTRLANLGFGPGGTVAFDIGTLASGTGNSNDICNDLAFDGANLRLVGRTDAFDAGSGDDVADLTIGLNGAVVGIPTVYHIPGDDDARRAIYDSAEGLIVIGSSQTGLLIIDNGTPVIEDVQPGDFERGVDAAVQADHGKLAIALDAGLGTNPTRDLTAVRYYLGALPPAVAHITIVEDATCPNAFDFPFKTVRASDSNQTTFNVGLTQTSKTLDFLGDTCEEDYSLLQTLPAGWSLQSVATMGGETDTITGGANIYLDRGDNVTVTFTNKDTTLPTVTTKAFNAVLGAAGTVAIQPQDVFAGGTDVCGVTPTGVVPSTFNCANIGPNTVTLTVKDGAGNASTATATVTVVDSTPPTLKCKNITRQLDAGGRVTISAADVYDAAASSDNCGQINLQSVEPAAFDCTKVGDNPVTLTADDGHGNTSTCSAVVHIQDVSPPAVTCKNAEVLLDEAGKASIVAADLLDNAQDNCGVTGTSLSKSTFDCGNAGPNQVTVSVTDQAGNPASCTATVTVKDSRPPQFTSCPTDISKSTDPGQSTAAVSWTTPAAVDNCTASVSSDHQPGEQFPVGTTSVTYTATDSGNQPATCSFSVTVTDGESPTWTGCPQNIAQPAEQGACGAAVSWTEPTASDNLAVTRQTKTHEPGAVFPVGTTQVIYTAYDAQNNPAACSFTVKVTDAQGPEISTCPSDRTMKAEEGCGAVLADLTTEAQAGDNCQGQVTITQSPLAGARLGLGTTPVLITATDLAGNITTCTTNVTVADQGKPQITTCPASRHLAAGSESCQTPVPDLTAEMVVSDGCDPNPALTQTPSAGTLIGPGDTVITLQATDHAGNVQTCAATLTVEDKTAPSIPPVEDRLLSLDIECAAPAPNLLEGLKVLDNCDPAPLITQSPSAGEPLTPGENNVTLTAKDSAGNSSSRTVKITVVDTTPPQISCPEATLPLSANGGCQAAIPDLAQLASMTDNCLGGSITQEPAAGQLVAPGPHPVTLTATDAAGLTSTCSITVTVDTAAPTLACPAAPAPIAANEHGQGAVPDLTAVAIVAESCLNATVTQDPPAGTMLGLGEHVVVLTATSEAGLSSTCNVPLKIVDQTPPSITCPADLTISKDVSFDVNTLPRPVVKDNGDPEPTVTAALGTEQPGECPIMKTVTVTWTASDRAGNRATCDQRVVITDIDSDNDGAVDCQDHCPSDPNKTEPGACGCGKAETADCATSIEHQIPTDSGQQTPTDGADQSNGDQNNAPPCICQVLHACAPMSAVSLGMISFGLLGMKSMYAGRRRRRF
jgi:hypothetical protein